MKPTERAELLGLSFDTVTMEAAVAQCLELCRAPRTSMTVGRVPGTGMSPAAIPVNLRPSVQGCSARTAPGPALARPRCGAVRGAPHRGC